MLRGPALPKSRHKTLLFFPCPPEYSKSDLYRSAEKKDSNESHDPHRTTNAMANFEYLIINQFAANDFPSEKTRSIACSAISLRRSVGFCSFAISVLQVYTNSYA